MTRNFMSKTRLRGTALTTLILTGYGAFVQAQMPATPQSNLANLRAPRGGGQVDPGSANGRSVNGGGRVDPGGASNRQMAGGGVRIGSDGANNRGAMGGRIDPGGANNRGTLGGRVDPGGANNRGAQGGRVDPGISSSANNLLAIMGLNVGGQGAKQPGARPQEEPTSEILVFLQPGTNCQRFANDHGVLVRYALKSDPNAYVVVAASPAHAAAAFNNMAHDRRVRDAYPNRHRHVQKMDFVPNDPYFHMNTPAAGWPGQWHLLNEHTPGLDARVQGAWHRDVTGQGVTIGIVDDSLQWTHPDLGPNFKAADSWNFGNNTADPSPDGLFVNHGTSVAGVAAARGGNGIGGTGAAPFAGLAGLSIPFDMFQTDAMFVDATLYHSSGTNRNIKVKNHSYGNQFDYIPEDAQTAALATSTAAGTIHCFAAANFRDNIGEDPNKKAPQNSPDAITVAALGSSGQFATYSSYGANVFVTAPSSSGRLIGYDWEYSITTTDRTGEDGYNPWGVVDYFPDYDYTSQFGGTSSATPLVAGVMALGKQAQPNLNTRFAKHLLALTSDVVDPNDSTYTGDGDGVTAGSAWKRNAAGILFNQNYGMGLINADAFTKMATQYTGVSPLQVENTGLINAGVTIPDNSWTGIRRTFTINSTTPLEEMQLTLNITHPYRGDITAYLTSPRGTRARVMCPYWHFDPYDTERDIHWTYSVNTFWGENPQGTWTLEVMDVTANNVGTLDSFSATARMGTLVGGTGGGGGNTAGSSVTVANSTGAIGQSVNLSATLKRTSDGVVLTGGTLSFSVNGTAIGTATTNANGVATLKYKVPDTLGLGGKPITVDFAGSDLYSASTGNGTLTITKANTSVTVPAVSGNAGQTVTLKGTLKRTTDNVVLYGGTLTFKVDGVILGTGVTDNTGVATLSYTIPAGTVIGAHALSISFAGTTYYNASAGNGTLQVKDKTSVAVASVAGARGNTVTLSATLKRLSDGVVLYGGTLSFKVDGVLVGTGVTDGTGKATLAYTIPTTMLVGTHKIAVSFAGTTNYSASTGNGTLTVN